MRSAEFEDELLVIMSCSQSIRLIHQTARNETEDVIG
jgi:hypothetical protein